MNQEIQSKNREATSKGEAFWQTRRLARIALLIGLSAVGAFIKIPSPTGTVALDSAPGYFGALAFGSREGAIIASLGHLFSAATVGFPLTLPLHLFIALQMAVYAAAFGWVMRRFNLPLAVIIATLLNGIVAPALFIPLPKFGPAFFTVMVVPLTVASAVNVIIAGIIYRAMRAGRLV